MILASTIEVVPIWKKRKRIYFMDGFIYREFYGPALITINMGIYEMDESCEVIFHNYLVRKEGLHNTLVRFLKQFIQDGEHYILIYKEPTNWTGKGIKIQEHDRCVSDIIAVDICDDKDPSEHPPFPDADEKILVTKTHNYEKRATPAPV
jgi:hypothetical protein